MEAIAIWDFTSNTQDLLSFAKGDIIQILCQRNGESVGGTWYTAQLNGQEGLVSRNMIEVIPVPWFKNNVDRKKAELLLTKSYFHKFIIRPQQNSIAWFLSYKAKDGQIWHFKITRNSKSGKLSFFSDDTGRREFISLNKLASYVSRCGWYSAPWWTPYSTQDENLKVNKYLITSSQFASI